MRLNRPGATGIAGALAFALAVISPLDVLAQGEFFDFLFGPDQPPAFSPHRSWRVMRARPRQPRRPPKTSVHYAKPEPANTAETDSMSGDGYCVRACDGYYFPLIKLSRISDQHSCELACPSAQVQLYEGATIEQAHNAKGQRYSALPAAFSFRDKLTAGCACNDPAASHDYYLGLSRRDPTLQTGDIVVGEKGAFIYSRSSLVSVSHASRQIRARLRGVLSRNVAPDEARASQNGSVALNKTQRPPK
ncbi:DUF2865 domain-containing protein [Methylocystis rosea]|uniref:DUF2865 domain-containing protein n=2 Tax=Methylocystis rosea TaxID=173366 RepID=A0A3G8M558_9HYPH|nr:DUF2865 domain-containing protein [Methylocystis rosea]